MRDLVDRVDEDDAAAAEALDDVAVVDDFVIDVERRAEELEGRVRGFDGHVDAGAEAAGTCQDHMHSFASRRPTATRRNWITEKPQGTRSPRKTGATASPVSYRRESLLLVLELSHADDHLVAILLDLARDRAFLPSLQMSS